jgi:hypothetical protein
MVAKYNHMDNHDYIRDIRYPKKEVTKDGAIHSIALSFLTLILLLQILLANIHQVKYA